MKRFSFVLSSLIGLSLLLSACQPATTPTPEATSVPTETQAPPPTAVPVEFTLWLMPNGADSQGAIDAEVNAFMAANPNIKVNTEVVGWGDAYGRIQTAVQGGEGPCITQLGTTWVPTFGTMGGLYEFTADDIAALGGQSNFVAASWATAGVEGKTVSIPWFADVRAIAYRKDILDKVGVTPEEAFKDVDSFVATLKKIKAEKPAGVDGNPIAPFIHAGRNDWNIWQNASMWMWAYGGDLLNSDGTKAAFNSDAAVKGVTAYYSLYGQGLTSEDTLELNSAQTDGRFGEGNTFAYMTGPWIISNARNVAVSGWNQTAADNLAFAQMPAGPGGQYTFVGGSNLAILKTCKYQKEAFEVIKYLTSKESQIRYANAIGMLPATLDGQNDTAFTKDPLFSVFIESAKNGKTAMNIPAWGQVENTINPAFGGLWETVGSLGIGKPISEAAVKSALDEAAATVDTLLTK